MSSAGTIVFRPTKYGIVPRADVRDDADRLERHPFRGIACGHGARRDHVADVRDVPVDALEHGRDLGARLADRLAHLLRRQLRALFGLGREQVPERTQRRPPRAS